MMMEDMDVGLNIPANFPLLILEKLLVVMGEVGIGTRPSTLTPITQVTMVDFSIYLVLLAMWTVLLMKIKDAIVGFMVKDMELGLKISSTLTFKIMDKVLLVMVEVYLGHRQAPLPPIIQVCLVDHWVLIVIVMTEADMDIRPSNFIHITMVDYTFTIQGLLNNIFQGVCKEKIQIKIIIMILIQSCHHTLIQSRHNILIATLHIILI